MDRAALANENKNTGSGLTLKYTIYLLFILLAPFLGARILFLLTFVFLLSLKFLGKTSSRTWSMKNLAFSTSVLLLISVLFEGLAFPFPLYIVLGAFAISAIGEHVSYFKENRRAKKVPAFENSPPSGSAVKVEIKEEVKEEVKRK